jgi:5,10-methylenetetrahydromethanopterin reductase
VAYACFTAHDRSLGRAREVWQLVERCGFDAIGVVDSPLLMREALVSMATLAADTTRIRVFSSVLNTLTRDPTVVAGAYLALEDIAPGRVFLAFGSGDSSTHGTGLGTARLAQIEEYLTALRALLEGETAHYHGRQLRGAWGDFEPRRPPLFLSAHGPRSLALAGRVADGVLCGFGLLPETIEHAEEIVRESAAAAGRDPDEIEIWHVAYFCPAESVEEGFLHANGAGAAVLARSGMRGKLVPESLRDGVARTGATWRLESHGRASPRTVEVARESGCLDYLVERGGGLIGPGDHAEAIRELHRRGAHNLHFVALGADKTAVVAELGIAIAAVRARPERRG